MHQVTDITNLRYCEMHSSIFNKTSRGSFSQLSLKSKFSCFEIQLNELQEEIKSSSKSLNYPKKILFFIKNELLDKTLPHHETELKEEIKRLDKSMKYGFVEK